MAATYQSATNYSINTASASWETASHTTATDDNRLLVVFVETRSAGAMTVNTVAINGESLASHAATAFGGSGSRLECWFLANPPASGTITVGLSASVSGSVAAFNIADAAQTTTLKTATTGQFESATTVSIDSVASAAGELLLDVYGNNSNTDPTLVSDTGQTQRIDVYCADANFWIAASTDTGAGASETVGYSWTGDRNGAILAVTVNPAGSSAALTGTATDTIDEADVVTGGPTTILTLTGDTYIAADTGPIGSTANSEALIDGIDSAQSEAGGWDAKVKAAIKAALATYLVRTSDTVATITIPPTADYDITAQETITATIPAAVLTGAAPIVASPTFTVDTEAATPSLVSRHHPRGVMRGTMRGSS